LIALTARVEADVPDRRELRQALLAWATAARREAGILEARVYEDMEAPAAFCLVAHWDSQRALEAHIRGAEFGAVLGALELLAHSPELSITALCDAMGTIRRLRSGAHGDLNPRS
jgi:quinol monooxygenase YgiN